MKFISKIMTIFLLIIAIIISAIFYAFKIEPYQVKVKEYQVNNTSANNEELRIAQISDNHIKEDYTTENLAKVINKLNANNPDIVVFTGDLYDNYAKYNDDANLINELSKIKSKYGKFAIWGNHDYGGGASIQYPTIMENSGFQLLANENAQIITDNGKIISLTGIDDSMLGNPSTENLAENINADYKILLSHEPDSLNNYINYDYNLAMSGHSHGGQVNIPFFPSINEAATSTTNLASNYKKGLYHIGENGLQNIFVNSGIGTTHISARFGVKPEISILKISL